MLKAKVALITGSTSGIGLGIARGLAQSGAHIVLNGFGDRSEIEELRAGIQAASDVEVIYNAADMSKPDEIVEMITETRKILGSVDIVVNNAGIQHVAPLHEFPPERFETIVHVMLEAPFRIARAVLPAMYERGWGRFVNISSAHGLRASPFKAAYIAAKHGLEGLSKVIALEGAPHGVTSNCICPAFVRTPLVERQIADQAKAHGIPEDEVIEKVILEKPALKRLIEPEEVAELAVFLCTPAASFITGASLAMDGGWTAQ